jgi:hypothetical protein
VTTPASQSNPITPFPFESQIHLEEESSLDGYSASADDPITSQAVSNTEDLPLLIT